MDSDDAKMAVARRKSNDHYREIGLEAGETVHIIQPGFGLNDAKEALFRSTYSEPHALKVRIGQRPDILMVVTSAEQRYESFDIALTDSPLGVRFDQPAWKFEGWLMKSGFDPYGEVVRVRLVFDPEGNGEYRVLFQRVPTDPDPQGDFNLNEV